MREDILFPSFASHLCKFVFANFQIRLMVVLSSLNTTDISGASIAKLGDVADATSSTDCAWATVRMYTCILIGIVVEPDRFGLCSAEDRATLVED